MINRLAIVNFLICIFACSLSCQITAVRESTSPENTWRVSLVRVENAERPFVSLEATKLSTGEKYASGRAIYYEGVFSPSFDEAYPSDAWLKENVLWTGYSLASAKHTLVIQNDSDQTINFLKIKTEDLYFAFEILPRTSATLPLKLTDNERDEVFFTISLTKGKTKFEVTNHRFKFPRGGSRTYVIQIEKDQVRMVDKP